MILVSHGVRPAVSLSYSRNGHEPSIDLMDKWKTMRN